MTPDISPNLPTLAEVNDPGLFTPLAPIVRSSGTAKKRANALKKPRRRWLVEIEDAGGPEDAPTVARMKRLYKSAWRAYRFRIHPVKRDVTHRNSATCCKSIPMPATTQTVCNEAGDGEEPAKGANCGKVMSSFFAGGKPDIRR